MSDEVVAIIIIAIIVSGIVRLAKIRAGVPDRETQRMNSRGGQHLLNAAGPSPREIELKREVEDLRERVHVLERIATDGRETRALADEIESLRGR